MRYPLNTVAINDTQTLHGFGTASIALGASGFSTKQKNGVSTAALSSVQASGTPQLAKTATSDAALAIGASGAMVKAVPAYSSAILIDVAAHYGIPDPKNIPDEISTAHDSRIIRVRAEYRNVESTSESAPA